MNAAARFRSRAYGKFRPGREFIRYSIDQLNPFAFPYRHFMRIEAHLIRPLTANSLFIITSWPWREPGALKSPTSSPVSSNVTLVAAQPKLMFLLMFPWSGAAGLLSKSTPTFHQGGLMDPEIVNQPVDQLFSRLYIWGIEVLPNLLGAILLLIIGFWLAGFAARTVTRLAGRTGHIEPTLLSVLGSVIRYALIVVILVAALGQLGIETTSILAALGAAGLAIGLALQGTLANVAAGMMLLWLRPFKIGDYIEVGDTAGTMLTIGLFSSELKSWDGIFLFVPNSELWNEKVINYSRLPTRLLELKYGISYDDDIRAAKQVLQRIAEGDERALSDPAPQVLAYELGDSSVVLALRVWTRVENYWALKWDLTQAGKEQLEASGASIPFPQRDVHIVNAADGAPDVSAA
jgi:small conductance mechanosensitive channel